MDQDKGLKRVRAKRRCPERVRSVSRETAVEAGVDHGESCDATRAESVG